MSDVAMRNFHLNRPEEQLAMEQKMVKEMVRNEFQTWNHDDPVAQALHRGGAAEHVFGGVESTRPHELQLVQAWRPSPDGTWTLGQGVVHRVHHDDDTVTVQFLPDQHRCRLPLSSVKPQLDVTPVYPTIRLGPGERLPTASEIEVREHNANVYRQQQGIAFDAPIPGALESGALRTDEHLGADGHTPVVESDQWGIPATTLDALRNRSIPAAQVTGTYGQHFYTNLYKNDFYAQQPHMVSASGHVGLKAEEVKAHKPAGPNVVSHRYVPLHGPEMMQDVRTGRWQLADEQPAGSIEGPGLLG